MDTEFVQERGAFCEKNPDWDTPNFLTIVSVLGKTQCLGKTLLSQCAARNRNNCQILAKSVEKLFNKHRNVHNSPKSHYSVHLVVKQTQTNLSSDSQINLKYFMPCDA